MRNHVSRRHQLAHGAACARTRAATLDSSAHPIMFFILHFLGSVRSAAATMVPVHGHAVGRGCGQADVMAADWAATSTRNGRAEVRVTRTPGLEYARPANECTCPARDNPNKPAMEIVSEQSESVYGQNAGTPGVNRICLTEYACRRHRQGRGEHDQHVVQQYVRFTRKL